MQPNPILTWLLKEKSGNPVCLGLVFFFKLRFTFHLDFIAGNFSERHKEPGDLACLYLRKNCLSYCCSSLLAPCLELPCISLELLSWLLTWSAAEEGAQPGNMGSVVFIWNSRGAAQMSGSYLCVGFICVWETTAILLLPNLGLCLANPIFLLEGLVSKIGTNHSGGRRGGVSKYNCHLEQELRR